MDVAVRELAKESLTGFTSVDQRHTRRMKMDKLEEKVKQKKDVDNDVSSG